MKRFILSLCFVAFAGAGLVSCNDEAAEITPSIPNAELSAPVLLHSDNPGELGGSKRP